MSQSKNGCRVEDYQKVTAVVSLAGQKVLDPQEAGHPGFKQNVCLKSAYNKYDQFSGMHSLKFENMSTSLKLTIYFAFIGRYLADAIKEADVKPKVFVSTSGVGFYPPSMTKEYDESSEGGDFDFLSKLCTDWEKASQLPANLFFWSASVIYKIGSVVLGRNGGMIRQMFLPFYLGLGGPVGSGNQYLPWIHIHDVASLYLHAIETKDLTGVLNGVAPQLITNKEFAKSFGRALWRPSFIPLPTFVLNMMFSEERAKIMTEGQKVIPKKVINSGFKYTFTNAVDEALKQHKQERVNDKFVFTTLYQELVDLLFIRIRKIGESCSWIRQETYTKMKI
ncbi:Epimerase family protein SDR39U1, partial [Armadillidium vulgare]